MVAFGTSLPELLVSLESILAGQPGISIGNIVGSNIFNILFVLGLSATIGPLFVEQQLVKLDLPIMIGVSVLMLFFALDGNIGLLDGGLFFSGGLIYTISLIYQSRKEQSNASQEEDSSPNNNSAQQWLVNLGLIAVGLVVLKVGAMYLVDSATSIASAMGVSDLVIGLTIIALGTSLPEVATSVVASIRGERDLAVGNILGSNIFNILFVLGLTGILAPNGVDVSTGALQFDIPVMIAVSLACLPIFLRGNLIRRWQGLLFLAYYIVYMTYLILDAKQHETLLMFKKALLLFVIPLTVVTLVIVTLRAIFGDRQQT